MKVQTLVVTMHQPTEDYSLLEKMNIQTDAIVCNQCNRNEIIEFDWNGNRVKWISLAERGVGLNRNNGLLRTDGDICLFADDDVVYNDGYADIICDFYREHPDAEVVLFNFKVRRDNDEFRDIIKQTKKVKSKLTAYGTICITVKASSIKRNNILFHTEFGGGTKFSCGEDSLFLNACERKKMNIYLCDKTLGYVDNKASTWFTGYTDKYFFDKGVLFYELVGNAAFFAAVYTCLKHRNLYKEFGLKKAITSMHKGVTFRKKQYKNHE